jgi:peroxiredoxin Q/BCP
MKISNAALTAAVLAAAAASPAAAFAPSSGSAAAASAARQSTSSALNLAVGEAAPDFELVDQNGKKVKRSSFKKPLVVYFYPADSTPGCTKQATSFNAAVKDIRKEYGADVVGVSGQGVDSKQAFARELGLDFSILADEGTWAAAPLPPSTGVQRAVVFSRP